MQKKFLLVAATLLSFAAASFAADYVRVDLNYYCRGQLKCISPKKAGVQIVPRRDYPNGRHPDKCYYSITVNLEVTQEIELVYEVVDTGELPSAVIKPSIEPIRLLPGGGRDKNRAVECLEFQIDSETSPVTPCVATGWKALEAPITVAKGDKITIKAKFKKVAK